MAEDRLQLAAAAVLAYIRAREQWEIAVEEADRAAELRGENPAQERWVSYLELLRRHATQKIVEKGSPFWGDPPLIRIADSEVVSTTERRKVIKVAVRQTEGTAFRHFEYDVIDVDGEMRISGRREIYPDGSSMSGGI